MMLNPRVYGFRPDHHHSISDPKIAAPEKKQVSSACPIESEKTSREITVYQAQPLKISSSMEASMSSK
jgi:hypothetical protein